LFAVDPESAGYVRFEAEQKEIWMWDPTRGLRRRRRPATDS
jgi:hypothetical protein